MATRRTLGRVFPLATVLATGACGVAVGVGSAPDSSDTSVNDTAETDAGGDTSPMDASADTGADALVTDSGDAGSTVQHYLYVLPDYDVVVYDLDDAFREVKRVAVSMHAVLGVVASAVTGQLYVSWGSYVDNGNMAAYDLATDTVVYDRNYAPFGSDSMAITPDGRTIYMPTGEGASNGIWQMLDPATGGALGQIDSGGFGPHNTIVKLDGTRVYLGPRASQYLLVADTATQTVLTQVGPIPNDVRPFTVNGRGTLAYIVTSGFIGFYVADLLTGAVLFRVPVPGFTLPGPRPSPTAPSHGISLSPDERELYLIDIPYDTVHVFDVTGVPGSAPVKVADISVATFMGYGWIEHSRDGRYAFVGTSGDVIDTATRTVVGHLPAMERTKEYIEVDFQGGRVVFTPLSRSQGGYVP